MKKTSRYLLGLLLCLWMIVPVWAEQAEVTFDDPYYERQWGLEAIDWLPVWQQGLTGKGVRIGIIDSGADTGHEDLQGANVQGSNFSKDGLDDSDVFSNDVLGHGTFVAGLIAAQPNNGLGLVGVAPDAELYVYRAFSNTEGSVTTVLHALDQAIADGCHIVNLSMGMAQDNPLLKEGIQKAQDAGILVVAAVGNGNSGITTTLYPAGYEGVIGVGSVNEQLEHSYFSQTNQSVFVTAPGQSVWGLKHKEPAGYHSGSGTSYSAPIVTAMAALALELDPDLTAAEIAEMLRLTATDLGEPGYDTAYGHGLVNVSAFIEGFRSHFSVRYQLMGGAFSEAVPMFYSVLEGAQQLPEPVCEGHRFVGWYADEDRTVAMEQIAAGTTGAQVLYAKWEADGQGLCSDEAGDGDHLCDNCGAQSISSCEDLDRNHGCDECNLPMGTHEAVEGAHACDYCGQAISPCADSEDSDTLCDVCGQNLLQIRVEGSLLVVENTANVQLIVAEYDAFGRMIGVHTATEGAQLPICGQTRVFTFNHDYIPQLPWLEVNTVGAQ